MTEQSALWIQKGIPPVPGDTGSLESVEVVLDLLNFKGFSLADKGWIPKLPAVKGGGVYLDSPGIEGRTPVAMELGSITEVIRLSVAGADYRGRYFLETKLQRIASDARRFWLTEKQPQPVYLCWQAHGAARPQYALIYNLEIAQSKDPMIPVNLNDLTITIEREDGWRLIPPGANPKWASYIIAGSEDTWLTSGSSNASLYSGSGHAASGTCYNRQEFNGLYTFGTVNYIDIPASKIPGDLPAEVLIDVEVDDGATVVDVFIAKTTSPTLLKDRSGQDLPLFNTFVAAGASLGTDATFVTDAVRGVVHTPASALQRIAQVGFATSGTSEAKRLTWAVSGTGYGHINPTILKGTYVMFLRASQINGTEGYITARVQMLSSGGFVIFNSNQVVIEKEVTGLCALHNMGVVTIPNNIPSTISARGTGRQIEYDFNVELYATRNNATGAAVLDITDIILMPIEEGMVFIKAPWYTNAASQPYQNIYDNTGYFMHGKPTPVSTVPGVPPASNNEYWHSNEMRGSPIWLTPGVNNRLYFIGRTDGTDPAGSNPNAFKFDVFVNVAPRWSGVIDL